MLRGGASPRTALKNAEEELPHSIACRVTEWEWPRIRCEILVERESQKGIVIGKGGRVLKAAGTAVRQQLEPGAYLELFVKVEKAGNASRTWSSGWTERRVRQRRAPVNSTAARSPGATRPRRQS